MGCSSCGSYQAPPNGLCGGCLSRMQAARNMQLQQQRMMAEQMRVMRQQEAEMRRQQAAMARQAQYAPQYPQPYYPSPYAPQYAPPVMIGAPSIWNTVFGRFW